MRVNDFDYYLPQELIAQEPVSQRQMSKLLVMDKNSGAIEHKLFRDIIKYLKKGDCLVLNDTRVIPARLFGIKEGTGGKIEFVLLKRIDKDIWEVMLKPGKRAKPGAKFIFGNGQLRADIIQIVESGNRLVKFKYEGIFEEILERVGIIPLPPYITKKPQDVERYQTVYSRFEGSAAAPTAGLHFTRALMDEIGEIGVDIAYITLHVGLGTFKPVKVQDLTQHKMHSEYYKIEERDCQLINRAKKMGGRVIAVGTTSCRVLETVADMNGKVNPQEGWTQIFIYPGYEFKVLDALITNFHLPKSTLIMLVSALAGRNKVMGAYNTAIKEKYRFFSFGDAMFIK
ncbi:MAG: tRNA preQ1(34) S-adenosylmethionine ribosyltransferase-isomerase QueA [Clostridium sp.]|nr:tRNA preQ1(34) S-adenosylmethionine ribosyltransferase-isomerase QueA [Clostridium sp.]